MAIGSTVKQYPALIDTFATWQDDVDNVMAVTVNDCQSQIVVVENTLGTNPQGSVADVKTRLAVSLNNDGTIKNLAVGTAQLAATSVTAAKLGNDVAGNGLQGGNGSAIAAKADVTGGANLAKVVNVSTNGLAVKIDGTTIVENGSGQLGVKGLQRKSVTVNAANGQFAFNFVAQGLVNYADTSYQIMLTVNRSGSAALGAWATYSSKATTGFTIETYIPGTNGPAVYNASPSNMSVTVDVLVIG